MNTKTATVTSTGTPTGGLTSTCTMDSPIGTLTLVASAEGLRALMWGDDDVSRVKGVEDASDADSVDQVGDERHRADEVLAAAVEQLEEYFTGERTEFDIPLDPIGTEFQQAAWSALRTIPYGATWTYGAQARAMGDARKARAVGAANGRNPIGIIVPCHRVVGADGSLTGFAGGLQTKAWLLDHERESGMRRPV